MKALRAIDALTGRETEIRVARLQKLAKVRVSTLRSLQRYGLVRSDDAEIGPESLVVITPNGRELAVDFAEKHGAFVGSSNR